MNISPRPLSMVKVTDDYREILAPWATSEPYASFLKERYFIFLGEIPNQPDHCVLMGQTGKMYAHFHVTDFVELSEDEV